VVVALVGLVILGTALLTPVTIGWFAYVPLAGQTMAVGDAVVVSRAAVLGVGVLGLGLIGVAYVAGTVAGARRRPDTTTGPAA
jgi:heme/copper-type cytochrome/quinol oxidase subunit 1